MDKSYSKRRNPIFFLILIMSVAIDLGTLIHNLPPERKREVRDLEKVSIRRCKTECSLLFNSICVKEHLLPNYSKHSYTHTLLDHHCVSTFGPLADLFLSTELKYKKRYIEAAYSQPKQPNRNSDIALLTW